MPRTLRTTPFSLCMACIYWLVGCVGAPQTDFQAASEVLGATRQLEDRFRSGDLLGVADFYQADALLLGPAGFRLEGREAIDTYWARLVDPKDWRLRTRSIEGGGGLAYQRGTSLMTSRWDGAQLTSKVEFLFIWSRDQDGRWKILVDTYWDASEPTEELEK